MVFPQTFSSHLRDSKYALLARPPHYHLWSVSHFRSEAILLFQELIADHLLRWTMRGITQTSTFLSFFAASWFFVAPLNSILYSGAKIRNQSKIKFDHLRVMWKMWCITDPQHSPLTSAATLHSSAESFTYSAHCFGLQLGAILGLQLSSAWLISQMQTFSVG